LFQQYVHPAFEAQRLVLVTNQFGDNKVSVYALGHLKEGKTVADISASQGIVPTGVGDPKTSGPGAPLPTTAPDDILRSEPESTTQPSITTVRPEVSGGR
jgi:hypothetical protein